MKPKLLISRCLGFDKCRYDGSMISFELLDRMKKVVDFIDLCPEMEIGLPTPRESLRLVEENDQVRLLQPAQERDYTNPMIDYSHRRLAELPQIDGAILKGRSPSCGTKEVKIYAGPVKAPVVGKGAGIFARIVQETLPYLPVEEEGRLTNRAIRDHFFTKVYLLFRFRQIQQSGSMKDLSEFQANNKYLYFAYSQHQKNKLGALAANPNKEPYDKVCQEYLDELHKLLSTVPTSGNYINAFQHILGYFSKELSAQEREYLLDLMNKYKEDQLDRSVISSVLKGYAIKYRQEYLLNQTIFQPFPDELVILQDTGK